MRIICDGEDEHVGNTRLDFFIFFSDTAGDDEHVAVGNVGPDLAREAVLLARDWQVALHGRHHQRAAALDRHGLCQKKARRKKSCALVFTT